jgi:short-subunit dehydrogenase
MKHRPLNVLVTGASSGVGEAIALQCAKDGAERLFLCGRNKERLEKVAVKCSEVNSQLCVSTQILDVADEDAVRSWVERCEAEAPLELVFANAGVGTGIENEENIRHTFAVNVNGCVNTVLPVLAAFRENAVFRRRRQIVITASIAGYAPLSTCPAYAATKAAVKNWGLSLRGMVRREGVRVNVLCPGFIRSRITDRNTCPMPFFIEADRAAKVMLDRVDGNVGLIAFPWPMRLAVWFMSVLPWRLCEFISGILPEKTSTGGCKGRESERIAF